MSRSKLATIFGFSIFSIEAFYGCLYPTDDQFYKSPMPLRVFAWICENSILPLQDFVIGVRSKNIFGFGLIDLGKGAARLLQIDESPTIICVLIAGIFGFWFCIGAVFIFAIEKRGANRQLRKP